MRPLDPMNANDTSAAFSSPCECNCFCYCGVMLEEVVSDAAFLLRVDKMGTLFTT